ncbi:protease pro-enzyme activation domain-containing protein [Anaeromyxobacter diazotrophicus]|uniref:Peptidase S53 activation domain-containing protein n=1 Tax=Anaeromyxobacter diazotrophicus TaxID=2590199 RepID=A0A7I9VRR6_9BACT|nr:hypothetical protein AMYX_35210 [Anaeromyxobacter diazotrophicus]
MAHPRILGILAAAALRLAPGGAARAAPPRTGSGSPADEVVAWLGASGFRVESRTGTRVSLSGTAGQVAAAFRTELRRYEQAGQLRMANATELDLRKRRHLVGPRSRVAPPNHQADPESTEPQWRAASYLPHPVPRRAAPPIPQRALQACMLPGAAACRGATASEPARPVATSADPSVRLMHSRS